MNIPKYILPYSFLGMCVLEFCRGIRDGLLLCVSFCSMHYCWDFVVRWAVPVKRIWGVTKSSVT